MRKNVEIEEKSKITKKQYDLLVNYYNLSNSIFIQDNYYFDTPNLDLLNQHITLRIRKKPNSLKLTLKKKGDVGSIEQHLAINIDQFNDFITNGINTSTYFNNLNYKVSFITTLTTHRVAMLYEGGRIFLDKSIYNNTTDYEIEYEHNDVDECKLNFNKFLDKHNIRYIPTTKKSYRALTC